MFSEIARQSRVGLSADRERNGRPTASLNLSDGSTARFPLPSGREIVNSNAGGAVVQIR